MTSVLALARDPGCGTNGIINRNTERFLPNKEHCPHPEAEFIVGSHARFSQRELKYCACRLPAIFWAVAIPTLSTRVNFLLSSPGHRR